MDGCKTNAIANEELRSIVMTMNVTDMVDELDGLLAERLSNQTKRLLLVLCVWLEVGDRSDETGMLY